MKSAFGRWNSLAKSNTVRFLYCSLAATVLLALSASAQSTGFAETRTEEALLRFHNDFLSGTEYSQAVRYPATAQQVSAWSHLIIAVGQDAALIMTAGKTELVLKKMEMHVRQVDYAAYGVKILQSLDDKPLNTVLEIAATELADMGIQHATNMPVSVPGLRSGIAVYAVWQAGKQKERQINEAVNRQVELLQIANYVAPALAEISQLIAEVKSDRQAQEYLEVLSKMMARKAELNVYRQMQYERHQNAIEGIEGVILQEIDYNLAVSVAEGKLTPAAHRQVLPVAAGYAMGFETKEGLDRAIKRYIDQNKPPMESEQYVERIFNAVERQLGPIEKARDEINAYGGSAMHSDNQLPAFSELAAKTGVTIASARPPAGKPVSTMHAGATSGSGILFNPNLTYGTVTDVEGNTYRTIRIGTQTWMAENLRTTKYNDGTEIPLITGNHGWANFSTPAYCWFNNDKNKYAVPYGALYNWYTVETGKLCPTGWHVPSDAEWKALEMHLGMSQTEADKVGFRGTDQGNRLKETGTSHWRSPNGGTNSSGFTGLPGDGRHDNGTFLYLGNGGYWWSSTSYSQTTAFCRYLLYHHSGIYRREGYKKGGMSVRCIKTEEKVQIDFRNTIYSFEGNPYNQKNNEYPFIAGKWNLDEYDDSERIELLEVKATGFTGRDQEQLLIFDVITGNRPYSILKLICMEGGAMVILDEIDVMGDFKVSSTGISATEYEWLQGDAMCCPSIKRDVFYRWDGSKFTTAPGAPFTRESHAQKPAETSGDTAKAGAPPASPESGAGETRAGEKENVSTNPVKITVLSENYTAVPGITVYARDGFQSTEAITNNQGAVVLNLAKNQTVLLFAGDLSASARYSVATAVIKTDQHPLEEVMVLPFYPADNIQAAHQLDNIIHIWSTAFDFLTLADMANEVILKNKPVLGKAPGLGVPGVFSVLPVPMTDSQGRFGFYISGTFAKKLSRFTGVLSPNWGLPYCLDEHCAY